MMGLGDALPSPFIKKAPNFFSPSLVSAMEEVEEDAELSGGGEWSLTKARPKGCVLLKFCVTTIFTRDLGIKEGRLSVMY